MLVRSDFYFSGKSMETFIRSCTPEKLEWHEAVNLKEEK